MVKLVLGFAGSRCSAYSFIDLSYLELLVFLSSVFISGQVVPVQ